LKTGGRFNSPERERHKNIFLATEYTEKHGSISLKRNQYQHCFFLILIIDFSVIFCVFRGKNNRLFPV